jgi:hypothetical protein
MAIKGFKPGLLDKILGEPLIPKKGIVRPKLGIVKKKGK